MVEQIQEYALIIAPVLSMILGVLASVGVLLKPFNKHKNTINRLVNNNITESKVHRDEVRRLEAQVAQLNKKLNYLIEDKKNNRRGG